MVSEWSLYSSFEKNLPWLLNSEKRHQINRKLGPQVFHRQFGLRNNGTGSIQEVTHEYTKIN